MQRVVALGAFCDLASTGDTGPKRISIDVSEFAVLQNGERVSLHNEKGFSGWLLGHGATVEDADIWGLETVETITRDVLTVVLPDEGDNAPEGDDHPYEWLAELLLAHGIDESADQLRLLPYEVILSERVHQRLLQQP